MRGADLEPRLQKIHFKLTMRYPPWKVSMLLLPTPVAIFAAYPWKCDAVVSIWPTVVDSVVFQGEMPFGVAMHCSLVFRFYKRIATNYSVLWDFV